MASNSTVLADAQGEMDDWIEIFNGSTDIINLGGYYLSDDYTDLLKWQIPSDKSELTTLHPGGYCIIWADGQPEQGPFHLSFKLSKNGESVSILHPDGVTLVDSITFGNQQVDCSWGRDGDQPDQWKLFDTPSPGTWNGYGLIGKVGKPHMLPESNFHSSPILVEIVSVDPKDKVYYTLNGEIPTALWYKYSSPIEIEKNTVVNAIALRDGYLSSNVASRTFLINTDYKLPVISLITNPYGMFDHIGGIYMNPSRRGDIWEREARIQFFDKDTAFFEVDCGIRLQGATGRYDDKKSFRLFFREKYGTGRLKYPLWGEDEVDSFNRLLLHSGGDDRTSEQHGTLLRDAICTELWKRMGGLSISKKFAMLHINAEPWGIYNFCEDIDKDFICDHLGWQDLDLIRFNWGGWYLEHGDSTEWKQLLRTLINADEMDDVLYESIASQMDILSFTDLQAFIHFSAYYSWVRGVFVFKEKQANARWQWTIWDLDRTFINYGDNVYYLYYPINQSENDWPYKIMLKMLTNPRYKQFFINRLCDLLNTHFQPDEVLGYADSLASVIRNDIAEDEGRWNDVAGQWENSWDNLRQNLLNRNSTLFSQTRGYFGLKHSAVINLIQPKGQGYYQLNTLKLESFPWKGYYYQDVPISVEAIPGEMYEFEGWLHPADSLNPVITVFPGDGMTFQALFNLKIDTSYCENSLRISEIMYKPSDKMNSGDWLEVINCGPDIIDLNYWQISDSEKNHIYKFPAGILIKPSQYFVVCCDSSLFAGIYLGINNYIGNMNFNLGRCDRISLHTPFGNPVDSVNYQSGAPWPDSADGMGYSLERINIEGDGNLDENWGVSYKVGGSPGERRDSRENSNVDIFKSTSPGTFRLFPNYPNPFNPETTISFDLPVPCTLRLEIFDVRGRLVRTLKQEFMGVGKHQIMWDACDDQGRNVLSGVYLYRIEAGGAYCAVKKMVLMK
ncbi:CotH kinase family protein [bacterium]|nr:CotH kinase family protein [bacterium]